MTLNKGKKFLALTYSNRFIGIIVDIPTNYSNVFKLEIEAPFKLAGKYYDVIEVKIIELMNLLYCYIKIFFTSY